MRFTKVKKEELIKWLSELLTINTTNPPGNEKQAVEYIQKVLHQEGILTELISKDTTRPNLYMKFPSNTTRARVMLTGHLDVVPAEMNTWKVGPFSGEVKDGYIWGRGAHDCKGLVVMIMATFIELQRTGTNLDHGISAIFFADEEASGKFGAHFLVNNHPEKFDVDLIINEGGGMILQSGDLHYLLVNNAEKGNFQGKIIVKGTPGHSSLPLASDNALTKAADVFRLISKHRTTLLPSKEVIEFIGKLSGNNLVKYIFKGNWLTNFILYHPPSFLKNLVPYIDALLRPTIALTNIRTDNKINVIPGSAEIYFDARLLPGQGWHDLEQEITKALQGRGIDYDLIQIGSEYIVSGNSSHISRSLKKLLEDVVGMYIENVEVIPFQVMGATDMRYIRDKFNIPSFGFMPVLLEEKIEAYSNMIHGRDERISINNLQLGSSIMFDFVLKMDKVSELSKFLT